MIIKGIEVNIFRMGNGEYAAASEITPPYFFLTAVSKEAVISRAENAIMFYNKNVKHLPDPKKAERILRDNTRFAFLSSEKE